MRRILGVLFVVAAVVSACGGGSGGDNGGGGGGGGGGAGELPGGAIVIFGTSYDPTSLAVTGKTTTLKAGSPMVAVGRAFTPRPAAQVTVKASKGSEVKGPFPVTASNTPDNADLFALDLAPLGLAAGTWQVEFFGSNGRSVASGFVTITP
jgi:hypothetical protein